MASNNSPKRIWKVPSESESIKAIWMAFPSSSKIWGRSKLYHVQVDWSNVVRVIAKYKPINVLCDSNLVSLAKSLIREDSKFPVSFITSIPYDDIWMRDIGCLFRRDGKGGLECVNLNFNGWGNKQTCKKDQFVANKMAEYLNLPLIDANVTGESGAVITDGNGTLIANWISWHGSKRNPGKTKDQVEKDLLDLYGATKMIWLDGKGDGDITDNHIDGSLAFIDEAKLFLNWPEKSKESEYILSKLKTCKDACGRSFEIIKLPEPKRVRIKDPMMLKSYINYLVLDKDAIISVQFGDAETDNVVRQRLSEAYPGRIIEMVNLDNIYKGEGGIHCITMHEPFP